MSERQSLDSIRERALRGAREQIHTARTELMRIRAQLAALDPSAVLERGYAILTGMDGRALGGVSALHRGDAVNIRMRDGVAGARIEEISKQSGE